MKYSLAIFDMDGTILNTLEDLKDSLNFALKENGLPIRTLEETRRFVGNGIRRLVELGVPENSSKGTTAFKPACCILAPPAPTAENPFSRISQTTLSPRISPESSPAQKSQNKSIDYATSKNGFGELLEEAIT